MHITDISREDLCQTLSARISNLLRRYNREKKNTLIFIVFTFHEPKALLFSLYVVFKYSQILSCTMYCYYTNCKFPSYFSKTIQSVRIPFHDAFRAARDRLVSAQYSRFSVQLIEFLSFGSERS